MQATAHCTDLGDFSTTFTPNVKTEHFHSDEDKQDTFVKLCFHHCDLRISKICEISTLSVEPINFAAGIL